MRVSVFGMPDSIPQQTEILLPVSSSRSTDIGGLPEYLKPRKTMQIAVSGGVLVTDTERKIIDSADFQRLRGIRQLGLAHLVYPTALHTRFDHSIGTLGMSARMVQAIRQNAHGRPEERTISELQIAMTRLYALLHDITHIPFGHSVEDELNLLVRHDENEERIQRFLGSGSEIGKIIVEQFGLPFLEKLLHIYRWDGKSESRKFPADEVFIHDLVSNTVCADLLDYLQRDNFFCNLGISLEYHFINYLYLRRDEDNQLRVFVRLWKDDSSGGRPRRDTLSDLCRLLEARYLVAERVYFHHAKIVAGAMLGRAIQEAQEIGEITEEFMWDMTDELLLHHLRKSESEVAKRLATEVYLRRLYKEEHAFVWEDLQKPQAHSHLIDQFASIQAKVGKPHARREFENQIADIIGANPGDVLIYAPTRKMNRKEAEMNVLWKGRPEQFKDVDDPMVSPRLKATLQAHELLWSIRLLMRRTLTPAQRQLARELCELDLVTESHERAAKQEAAFTNIVANALATENRRIPPSAAEYNHQLRATVKELLAAGHKNESFSTRLRSSIHRNFPDALG